MADSNISDAQQQIINKAEEIRALVAGKSYRFGGSDTAGFDCSGFVVYVFNQAYGTNTLTRETANDLKNGPRFTDVSITRPSDLIFFSNRPGSTTASHVGIVVDENRWIGCQNSTGVAYVSFENTYWKPKFLSYGRYVPMQDAQAIIPMTAGMFASAIC